MRKPPPCKINGIDCPRRKLLCHGACKEWQKWKAEEEERKRVMYEAKELANITYSERVKKGEIKKIKEGRK